MAASTGFGLRSPPPFFGTILENEAITTLRLIHPFCFMDANSFYEQKQDAHDCPEMK
jgi:hypothetical protein